MAPAGSLHNVGAQQQAAFSVLQPVSLQAQGTAITCPASCSHFFTYASDFAS